MKAYILKIAFEHIHPTIWRRVILPSGATFNRLHETIQYTTNFQSYFEPYHFFAIQTDEIFSTNNETILEEYKGKKFNGKVLKSPTHMKIDKFLEQHGFLVYEYDFGDNWRIRVELEDTVEDYYFGYPTLLDGDGTAPPEDVGGPTGYEEFLSVYHDPMHPDYLTTYAWAESQHYLRLDIDEINERLKFVKYKKTEWQSIDHDNYFLLSDKYRGSDYKDIAALSNKDLIIQYVAACVHLYGVIEYPMLLEIYNSQNKSTISSGELRAILKDPHYTKLLQQKRVYVHRQALVHEKIELLEGYEKFLSVVAGKPYYVPQREELLRYSEEFYYEKTFYQEKLAKMLAKDFFGGSTLMLKEEMDNLMSKLQVVQVKIQEVVHEFLGRFDFKDMQQLNEYVQAISMIANTTRLWENRGHTPDELFQMQQHHLQPLPVAQFNVTEGSKVGRNDPCPCGSGKKYKKCCGK